MPEGIDYVSLGLSRRAGGRDGGALSVEARFVGRFSGGRAADLPIEDRVVGLVTEERTVDLVTEERVVGSLGEERAVDFVADVFTVDFPTDEGGAAARGGRSARGAPPWLRLAGGCARPSAAGAAGSGSLAVRLLGAALPVVCGWGDGRCARPSPD